MATGETVVIEAGTAQGVAVGQQFAARRLDGGARAFGRGVDGYAGIRTAALLTVTSVDDRFALARIDRACDGVMVGDYLEPITMPTIQAASAAGAPELRGPRERAVRDRSPAASSAMATCWRSTAARRRA